jgi:hypothetical protein
LKNSAGIPFFSQKDGAHPGLHLEQLDAASGECLRRITPAAAMVDRFVEITLNTTKTHLLPSNYSTFRSLVVCENFNPKTDPLLSSSMRRASFKCEMPRLELKSSQSFLAIKCVRGQQVKKLLGFKLLKQLNPYKGSGGNENLPPRRFPSVGIVRVIRQTTTQLPSQTSSPWCSVCPPYDVDSINHPNAMRGRPSAGVGQGLLGGVLYKSITNREINLILQLILFSTNCSLAAKNGGRNSIHH